MKFLFKSKPIGLGLDLSTDAIKILELHLFKGKPVLNTLYYLPKREDNLPYLKSLSQRGLLKTNEISLTLNDRAVITKNLSFAASLKRKDIEELIHIESEKHVGLASSLIHFDFYIQGKNKENQNQNLIDVLLIAVKAADILQKKSWIEKAGFKLKAVDTCDFALKRALNFLLKEYDHFFSEESILIFLEKGALRLFIIQDKQCISEKNDFFNMPFSLLPLNESLRKNVAFYKERIQLHLQLLMKEQIKPKQILLAGELEAFDELRSELEQNESIPTKIFNPLQEINYSKNVNFDEVKSYGPSFLIAFGLALRGKYGY